MNVQKIEDADSPKPKRVIYGGVLYHGQEFSVHSQLFGNSPNSFLNNKRLPNVWTKYKLTEAFLDRKKRSRGRLRVSTNEASLIKGTIAESIIDVGIYPVEVIVEKSDGKAERYLVTE